MRVLAIDTALEACSVAVLDTERAEVRVHESLPMQRGHAEALMPLIARVMDRAQLDFAALDRIAVTTGPGSFTGLRVGIAAARGIALAAGKPAVGLSTLAAFAAPFIAADDTLPVVVAIDARHDHVYLQVFGPGGRTVVAPRVAPLREAVRVSRPARRASPAPRPPSWRRYGPPANVRQRPSSSAPRPTSTGWRDSAPPRPTPARHRSRFTCARPTRIRRTRCNWPADDRLFSSLFTRAEPAMSEASARDASAIAALHGASFRRGWSEQEVEGLLA